MDVSQETTHRCPLEGRKNEYRPQLHTQEIRIDEFTSDFNRPHSHNARSNPQCMAVVKITKPEYSSEKLEGREKRLTPAHIKRTRTRETARYDINDSPTSVTLDGDQKRL